MGIEDGMRYCGDRLYTLNDPVPCWANIERNELIIMSDVITDAEEVATLSITVTLINTITEPLSSYKSAHSAKSSSCFGGLLKEDDYEEAKTDSGLQVDSSSTDSEEVSSSDVVGPIDGDLVYPYSLSGPITATSEIIIERYIAFTCNENCSPDDLIVNKEPDFLPASEYECNDNVEGTVNDNNVVK